MHAHSEKPLHRLIDNLLRSEFSKIRRMRSSTFPSGSASSNCSNDHFLHLSQEQNLGSSFAVRLHLSDKRSLVIGPRLDRNPTSTS